ncbi:MAG: Phosphoribosylformylglycinamidine synthase subunit PurQ [Candidatus Thorarchaeota archaeon]|nr:MAG: Phosphoribosylformylglycinamidine synthase subunit PurQ [Candidatus Thorarchaeota archaeon]
MAIAVIRFPGTNNEKDVMRVLASIPGGDPYLVPNYDGPGPLARADGVFIPGGFSYGDYLRAGAVASVEAIIDGVVEIAKAGKPVIGICNGFQILAEAGLLPGVLLPNKSARFVCKWINLRTCETKSIYTEGLDSAILRIPIAHAEGNYYCSEEDLHMLKGEGRVSFRYCNSEGEPTQEVNPNGSLDNIAGIVNERGNVLGMMPHPERASRAILGSTDGLAILENFVRATKAP